ncbi:hypothetical protein TNCV_1389551 [Trichonephila clavipes]|nr:hypothetical protein TNCV_1389551 [Trichonephila clavipes]
MGGQCRVKRHDGSDRPRVTAESDDRLIVITAQDNVRQHTARNSTNSLTARQALPWLARSPDFSPIETIWDMMGMPLYLPGNADDLAQELEQIWKKYCRRPSWFFITLHHVVDQFASGVELDQHVIEHVTL